MPNAGFDYAAADAKYEAERFAPTFAPEKGEVGEGEVRSIKTAVGEFGPFEVLTVCMLNKVRVNDGDWAEPGTEVAVKITGTVLQDRYRRNPAQVGDLVGFLYQGLGEARPGMNPPHLWSYERKPGNGVISDEEANAEIREFRKKYGAATPDDDTPPY